MDAIRYNGQSGSTAAAAGYKWAIPEWCPQHSDSDAGESQKKCYCTRSVGDGPGQVPEGLARGLVKLGSFDAISTESDPEE